MQLSYYSLEIKYKGPRLCHRKGVFLGSVADIRNKVG